MRIVLLFLLLIKITSAWTQEVIKADNLRQSNGQIIIEYEVKNSSTCLNVSSVQVVVKSSGQRLKALAISGDTREVRTGKRQIIWNYKADNFYAEGEVEVSMQVEPCVVVKPKITERPDIINKSSGTETQTSHPISLKIGVAVLGIGAGAGAFLIRSNFTDKQTKLNSLNTSLKQDSKGQLLTQADKNTWDTAYQETLSAKKAPLFNALVGVAALSAGYEAYLLLTKRKVNRQLSFSPSRQNMGVALTINF
ncbi:hypothetical protein [Runella sp.]|jgi:hypothetical protein|uniref:hypothetical protein n=1 Tax=Runella sp. TaxID=1960881 RepID=UPI0030158A66